MKKKKRKKAGRQDAPSLPLTPMIDCTFLLLIFFMLACRFRSEEGRLLAHLPKERGLHERTPDYVELDKIRVKLLWYSPDGRDYYNGTDGHLVLKVGNRVFPWSKDVKGNNQPDWGELREYARMRNVRYRPPPEKPEKKITAIIDARKSVPFYWIVRALDTFIEAGLDNIEFAASQIPY